MKATIPLIAAATALVAAGCVARPTEVTTTWIDPATPGVPFRRAVAIFAGGDSLLRRRVEDRLAQRLTAAVPSYTLVSDEELTNPALVKEKLAAAGFDGAVVLRLVAVDQVPPSDGPVAATPAEELWAYLSRTPRIAYERGETKIYMESRVYALPEGRTRWAGHSTSFNPRSLRELVDMIVDSATDEIVRQKRFFIARSRSSQG